MYNIVIILLIINNLHYVSNFTEMFQVCWLYNSTKCNIPFSVDHSTMREINRRHCHELFSCATTYGIATPLSAVPILLKFQPRRFGVFEVSTQRTNLIKKKSAVGHFLSLPPS